MVQCQKALVIDLTAPLTITRISPTPMTPQGISPPLPTASILQAGVSPTTP